MPSLRWRLPSNCNIRAFLTLDGVYSFDIGINEVSESLRVLKQQQITTYLCKWQGYRMFNWWGRHFSSYNIITMIMGWGICYTI